MPLSRLGHQTTIFRIYEAIRRLAFGSILLTNLYNVPHPDLRLCNRLLTKSLAVLSHYFVYYMLCLGKATYYGYLWPVGLIEIPDKYYRGVYINEEYANGWKAIKVYAYLRCYESNLFKNIRYRGIPNYQIPPKNILGAS